MDGHQKSPRIRYLDGDKLRRYRIENGMDQAALAVKAGTTQNQLAHHEAKDWGCHMQQLVRYAKALDRKPADLMLDGVLSDVPVRRRKSLAAA
jgi:transcriptional regulator with XRE-family HTH domain